MKIENTGNGGVSQGPGHLPGGDLLQVVEGNGRLAVCLKLLAQGRDHILLITGGVAHVGAVAVSDGGPAEVVVVPGHKEGPLAAECAQAVARTSGHTCTAIAGIHQEDAAKPEIVAIVANVRLALRSLLQQQFSTTDQEMSDDENP